MASFNVALAADSVCIAGSDAQLKVNLETNVPLVDRDTNAPLYTIQLMLMEAGRAELLKVTVPETGLPNGLKPGVVVKPLGLVATPWARIFNGNLSQGVAFRTPALTLVQPAAQTVTPEVEQHPADLAAEHLKQTRKAA
ncbi:hypothetical protein [Streptomyces triticagri]|uniref:hypothetical protein n=1 Tax=Streptomyces triticagri TaxID=2293568 RepID=UPI001F29626C|nr:hypothetical protein [Streptomyces triticagri]